MKKRLLAGIPILFVILLTGFTAIAQQKSISGKITDSADGTALAGVSVMPKGSTRGVVSEADGSFHLSVDDQTEILVLSLIGYDSKEVRITGNPLLITLRNSASSLNEVVVVGYGTQRKKDLTGSVATISEKDFQKGAITSPEQLIAGKMAGVSVISNGGQPGSGSTIRIRGGSSLNASNDPLIVIDGVPLDNDATSGASNSLSFINPNDIASFTVLKDASASAIYGTRASNGVIIITTKKGHGGPLQVNLSSVNSLSEVTKKVDVLNAAQFRAIVNAKGTPAQIAQLGTASTNWQDQIYQSAFGTNNNISVSGGIKNLPYRISLGYQNQSGILKTDNLQRTSLALVLNPSFFNNHLKVDLNLKGSMENARFGNQAAIGAATSFDPTQPVTAKSNRYGGYYEWVDADGNLVNLAGKNPVGLLNQRLDKSSPQRSIGNLQLDYSFHFLPELHANLNLGYDISRGKGTVFVSDSAAADYTRGGRNTRYIQKKQNELLEFYLNYVKDLPSIKSRVDVLAGYSYNNYLTIDSNFADYNAHGVKIANSDPAFPYNKPEHTLLSYFGRLNYGFLDRYLLTGTIRYDASSRFAPANRWGLFPSIAFAWKIKDESFLRNSRVVSNLKLRLGYGITGQQDGIGNYDYLSYYSLSAANASYQFGDNYYQMFRPGGFYANRKWEQTATTNIALDFGFLDNRISGSIDFYQKKTTDLLNNIPQPALSNFTAYIVANVGDMENKGVEFTLSAEPVRTSNFNWDLSFNITYNKNNITNLTVIPNDTSYIGFQSGSVAGGVGGQFAFINAVGGPKNTFYLYKQVYDNAGNPIEGVFVDKNGDGIINQNDLYKGKSADPNLFLGFSTSFTYKKWNAGFVLRANTGNYMYNNLYSQTGTLNQITGNAVLYNASTNYLATQFKGGNGQELLSDYYIQNASFLRMDNFSIGFNVGKIAHQKLNLQVNAIVQNVFVITKYKGLDPEIGAGTGNNPGIDNNFYPRPRVFSLGLNLNF
jgi:iron complex outermembrane receptor protein